MLLVRTINSTIFAANHRCDHCGSFQNTFGGIRPIIQIVIGEYVNYCRGKWGVWRWRERAEEGAQKCIASGPWSFTTLPTPPLPATSRPILLDSRAPLLIRKRLLLGNRRRRMRLTGNSSLSGGANGSAFLDMQKAWEAAQAPVKNLLMMGFMMWMAGSTVHLFSIGITFSALWQPVSALQSIGKVFEPFQDAKTSTFLPKVAFAALNLAAMGLGLWKLNSMGLLPTHASDWLSNLAPPQFVEFSGGRLPLLL